MRGQSFLFIRQQKNGRWRLYKNESQALMSWRGDNAKTTVVREERLDCPNYNQIINFPTADAAKQYAKDVLNQTAFEED